jgi:hypothetical protein
MPVTLHLTYEQAAALRRRAEHEGRSVQQVTNAALDDYLHRVSRATPAPWVIGTGLDVWEILELLRSHESDEERLHAAHPLVGERHVRAYGERFPDEIAPFVDDVGRPLDELRRLYRFLQTG